MPDFSDLNSQVAKTLSDTLNQSNDVFLNKLPNAVKDQYTKLKNVGRNPADVINNGGSSTAASTANWYTFPRDLPPIHLNLVEADIKISTSGNQMKASKMYRLPIPLQLNDNQEVAYNDNLSYLHTALNAAFPGSIAAQSAVNAANLGGAVGGFSVNGLKGVALEQPNFKKHQLSWKLSPKDPEDSQRIQRIITGIKIAALPHQNETFGRGILHFPKVFIPFFYPNVSYLYKFKPCVIANIEVDYVGGNQAPGFFGGTNAPESVILKITLLEIEYWMREDMREEKLDENGLPSSDFQDPFNFVNQIDLSGISINS